MPRHTQTAKHKDESGAEARCRAQRTQVPSAQPLSHQVIQRAETDPGSLIPTDVVTLQRIVGNRAVGRLLGRGRSITISPGPTSIVQRAITVGAADDALEREAEDIAEKVMRRADRPASGLDGSEPPGGQGEPPLRTQRLVAPRDGAHDPDPAVGPDGGGIGGALEAGIRKMQGGGRPLDKEWRVPMEEATRHDYGDVRLHVNQESDRLNAALGARAFTLGKDIFLKSREYRPGSLETRKLLFHEMVHVGHQTDCRSLGKIQRQLDLDSENWEDAQEVAQHQSEGVSPIFFLYEKKKKKDPDAQPKLVVKLIRDGPQQMLAAEMMAELKMPGTVRTKVVPRESKSGKELEKTIRPLTSRPYDAFMVMEFAKNLTTLAGMNLAGLSDQEFETMVQSMMTSRFFYDLGRIHGADMYMGNEDRLREYRMAIKNIFVNKLTGQLLPIDLGLVAVSKDAATKGFQPENAKAPVPPSVSGMEAKDWVNLTITGSFTKNRMVKEKEDIHGTRGAAFFTPDFRGAVLANQITDVWKKFNQEVQMDLKSDFVRKESKTDAKLKLWGNAIDSSQAEPDFQQGVYDAITFYTSRGQAGHWAEKVEDVKKRFNLTGEAPYLDAKVFALKDRYVELVRAGCDDAEARKRLKAEVEQGRTPWARTAPKVVLQPTVMLGQRTRRMAPSPASTSTTTTATATVVPATNPSPTMPPLPMPPSSTGTTTTTTTTTAVPATNPSPTYMPPLPMPPSSTGTTTTATTAAQDKPAMSWAPGVVPKGDTTPTDSPRSIPRISDETIEYLKSLALALDESSESERKEKPEKEKRKSRG